jgi:hypothetical protein
MYGVSLELVLGKHSQDIGGAVGLTLATVLR